jgi:hypothetical protein
MSRAVVVVGMLAGFGFGYLGLAVGSIASADARPKPTAAGGATSAAPIEDGPASDPAGWTQIGQAVLTGEKSTATIALRSGKAKFEQLALVVNGGDLDVSGVTVVTPGGSRIVRSVKHRFGPEATSARIDLGSGDRAVKTIVVAYDLAPDATATLTVYGRDRASAAARRSGGAPSSAGANKTEVAAKMVSLAAKSSGKATGVSRSSGWTLLGTRTVDGKNDADVIRAAADDTGLYSQLAIVVTGGDLELKAMKLRFDGGRSADLDTRYYFRGDEHTKLVTLPAGGSGTTVRMVQLKYGADKGAGKTRVEIWAR